MRRTTRPRSASASSNPNCFAIFLVPMRARNSSTPRFSIVFERRAMSICRESTVEHHRRAGDPRRFVGSKIHSHLRNVFGFAHAAERDSGDAALAFAFGVSGIRDGGETKSLH